MTSHPAEVGEGQGVEVSADDETVGDGARKRRVDRPEGGTAVCVMAEVVEQIGAIADVSGRKGQRIEVVADDEEIGDDPDDSAGFDGAETGDAAVIMAEVVENNRPKAHIGGRIGQRIERAITGVEAIRGSAGTGGDGIKE